MKRAAIALGLMAAAAGTGIAEAQELRRLFFTPEQRAALDARRKARVPDKPAATPQVESPVTRVNGAVRRADGRSTVWVNGQAIPEGPGGPKVAPRASSVTVPVGEGAQPHELRVGETLDRGNGEVRDVLGGSEVTVGPRRAPAGK